MKSATTHRIRALFFGLSEDLAVDLAKPLKTLCSVRSTEAHGEVAGSEAHIIFCGADTEVVGKLRTARPDTAIVVVSRHPEVSGWLDAMDAGATDYCAAPFEATQMKWILDSSLQSAPQRQ